PPAVRAPRRRQAWAALAPGRLPPGQPPPRGTAPAPPRRGGRHRHRDRCRHARQRLLPRRGPHPPGAAGHGDERNAPPPGPLATAPPAATGTRAGAATLAESPRAAPAAGRPVRPGVVPVPGPGRRLPAGPEPAIPLRPEPRRCRRLRRSLRLAEPRPRPRS